MNKELKRKIIKEVITWGDGMVSDYDFADRVISLCADEAIDVIKHFGNNRPVIFDVKTSINKAIEKRMK